MARRTHPSCQSLWMMRRPSNTSARAQHGEELKTQQAAGAGHCATGDLGHLLHFFLARAPCRSWAQSSRQSSRMACCSAC